MSGLEGFDGKKIVEQRSRKNAAIAAANVQKALQVQIDEIRRLLEEAQRDREEAAEKLAAINEKLAEIDALLVEIRQVRDAVLTFADEGIDEGDEGEVDFDDVTAPPAVSVAEIDELRSEIARLKADASAKRSDPDVKTALDAVTRTETSLETLRADNVALSDQINALSRRMEHIQQEEAKRARYAENALDPADQYRARWHALVDHHITQRLGGAQRSDGGVAAANTNDDDWS